MTIIKKAQEGLNPHRRPRVSRPYQLLQRGPISVRISENSGERKWSPSPIFGPVLLAGKSPALLKILPTPLTPTSEKKNLVSKLEQ